MVQLIKNISGEIISNTVGGVNYVKSISGEAQQRDYISLNGFIGYIQNLNRVEETVLLQKPITFGLNNKYNLTTVILEIDY